MIKMVSSLNTMTDSLGLVSTRIMPFCAQVLTVVGAPPARSRLTVSSVVPAWAAPQVKASIVRVRVSMRSLQGGALILPFYPLSRLRERTRVRVSARPRLGAGGGLGGQRIVGPVMLGIAPFQFLFYIEIAAGPEAHEVSRDL